VAEIGGVLCCGNIVFDILVYPAADVEWNTTRWVDTITESMGGNGSNTSYVIAKMGVPVRLLSLVGSDERGDALLRILGEAGVDTSGIGRAYGTPTPSTCVLVQEGGARKFYHRPGASRDIDPESLKFAPRAHSHFHLANPFSMSRLRTQCGTLMRRAKDAGFTTSIDTGWDSLGRWIDDLGPALGHTDVLFANDAEAEMLGGGVRLRDHGVRDIVLKQGAGGCTVNGERFAGFAVHAVDTTGAGDCFAGAFLAGMQRGLSFAECARLANAVGAMNVEALGATTGVRGYEETLAWMQAKKTA
jgi:sugar/nucleoside kinase (ribokinase family)